MGREVDHRFHHRAEAGDRATAEVVAVREAARQDDAVAVPQVAVLVPEVLQLRPQDLLDDPAAVPVGSRPREDHDPELHPVGVGSEAAR